MGDWYPADEKDLPQDLEWRETEITKERRARAHQVRLSDRRVWDSFSPSQKDAAQELYYGHMMYLSKSCPQTSRMEKSGKGVPSEWGQYRIELWETMTDWKKMCRNYRINTQIVIDHITQGIPLKDLDRSLKRRNGTALKMIKEALNAYCTVRGWPVHE